MNKFWQENDPAFYSKTRAEIESKYPTLHFDIRQRIVFLLGTFPVGDAVGVLDRFLIEIQLPKRFPRSLPVVREVGHRIPRIAERHMYSNGVACLLVEEDWWASHPEGHHGLIEFLDGPVRNYFLGQAMVALGMDWPFGERSHGPAGVLECYAHLTGTSNLAIAEEYLRLLAMDGVRGHHKCPCGSGKNLRQCHMSLLLELSRKIPRAASRRSMKIVEEYQQYTSLN